MAFSLPASVDSNKGVRCGIPNTGPLHIGERIIGGNIVNPPNKYPWMVYFELHGSPHCGATIVSETLVLTAAHCLYELFHEVNDDDISLYAGLFDVNNTEHAMKLDVKWSRVHKKYKYLDVDLSYDFGLIKLATPIKFNQNVRPVCLPTTNEWKNYQGVAMASGWGNFNPVHPQGSQYLREVELPFIPNPKCVVHTPFDNKTDYQATTGVGNKTMVCAGYEGKGHPIHKTVGHGDSGGPLVIKGKDGVYTQVGVVSWCNGEVCNEDAAVFARVTAVLDWIRKYM